MADNSNRLTVSHIAPAPPHDGEVYYDAVLNQLIIWTGSQWVSILGASGMTNPMIAQDDVIVGGAAGAPGRLAKGANGTVLTIDSVSGHASWNVPTGGISNPMTTRGDLITGAIGGSVQRLGLGASATVLRSNGTDPAWTNLVESDITSLVSDLALKITNPMTTKGDIIVADTAGVPLRKAVGTDAFVLTADSTQVGGVKWAASAGGMTNPMTTVNDLIIGGASGVPARLAKGTDGQVLTVDPTTHNLLWLTPSTGTLNTVQQFADSSANLANNATFTGTGRDTGNNTTAGNGYSRFRVFANADQAGTMLIDQSPDNITWYNTISQVITASSPTIIESVVTLRYIRTRFTNTGGSTQTTFLLASALVAI